MTGQESNLPMPYGEQPASGNEDDSSSGLGRIFTKVVQLRDNLGQIARQKISEAVLLTTGKELLTESDIIADFKRLRSHTVTDANGNSVSLLDYCTAEKGRDVLKGIVHADNNTEGVVPLERFPSIAAFINKIPDAATDSYGQQLFTAQEQEIDTRSGVQKIFRRGHVPRTQLTQGQLTEIQVRLGVLRDLAIQNLADKDLAKSVETYHDVHEELHLRQLLRQHTPGIARRGGHIIGRAAGFKLGLSHTVAHALAHTGAEAAHALTKKIQLRAVTEGVSGVEMITIPPSDNSRYDYTTPTEEIIKLVNLLIADGSLPDYVVHRDSGEISSTDATYLAISLLFTSPKLLSRYRSNIYYHLKILAEEQSSQKQIS